jgi:hypothetical protein
MFHWPPVVCYLSAYVQNPLVKCSRHGTLICLFAGNIERASSTVAVLTRMHYGDSRAKTRATCRNVLHAYGLGAGATQHVRQLHA